MGDRHLVVGNTVVEVLCDELKNNCFSIHVYENSFQPSDAVRLSALRAGRPLPPGRFLVPIYNNFYAGVP
jgi:hypothetical protein